MYLFYLFFLVLCTICCQFLWIVLSIVDCPFDILLRLFTYIYFHFIFLMLYSAHASDWDHFTFAQEWPQTACMLGKKEVRTQFIFKIETDMKIGLYITLVKSGFDQMSNRVRNSVVSVPSGGNKPKTTKLLFVPLVLIRCQ